MSLPVRARSRCSDTPLHADCGRRTNSELQVQGRDVRDSSGTLLDHNAVEPFPAWLGLEQTCQFAVPRRTQSTLCHTMFSSVSELHWSWLALYCKAGGPNQNLDRRNLFPNRRYWSLRPDWCSALSTVYLLAGLSAFVSGLTCNDLDLLCPGSHPREVPWQPIPANVPSTDGSAYNWLYGSASPLSFFSNITCEQRSDHLIIYSTGIPSSASYVGRFPFNFDSDGDGRNDNPNTMSEQSYAWKIPRTPAIKNPAPPQVRYMYKVHQDTIVRVVRIEAGLHTSCNPQHVGFLGKRTRLVPRCMIDLHTEVHDCTCCIVVILHHTFEASSCNELYPTYLVASFVDTSQGR